MRKRQAQRAQVEDTVTAAFCALLAVILFTVGLGFVAGALS